MYKRQAYESEIDTLEEYKANKERLTASRLKLNSQIENLLHDQEEPEIDTEKILREIKSVNDILKNICQISFRQSLDLE